MTKQIRSIEGKLKGRTFRHGIGPVTLISGPNDSGKTTVLDALELALRGVHHKVAQTESSRHHKALHSLMAGGQAELEAIIRDEAGEPLAGLNLPHGGWRGPAPEWYDDKLQHLCLRPESWLETGAAQRRSRLLSMAQTSTTIEAERERLAEAVMSTIKPSPHRELVRSKINRVLSSGSDGEVLDWIAPKSADAYQFMAETKQARQRAETQISATVARITLLRADGLDDSKAETIRLQLGQRQAELVKLVQQQEQWRGQQVMQETRRSRLEVLRSREAELTEAATTAADKLESAEARLEMLEMDRPEQVDPAAAAAERDRCQVSVIDATRAVTAATMRLSQAEADLEKLEATNKRRRSLDNTVCPHCGSTVKLTDQDRTEMATAESVLEQEIVGLRETVGKAEQEQNSATEQQQQAEAAYAAVAAQNRAALMAGQRIADQGKQIELLREAAKVAQRLLAETAADRATAEAGVAADEKAAGEAPDTAAAEAVAKEQIADLQSQLGRVGELTALREQEQKQRAAVAELVETEEAYRALRRLSRQRADELATEAKQSVIRAGAELFSGTLGEFALEIDAEGELVLFADGEPVREAAWGGGARLLVTLAVAFSIATATEGEQRWRGLVVDELGRLDGHTQERLLTRMVKAVRDGAVTQFIGAGVRHQTVVGVTEIRLG